MSGFLVRMREVKFTQYGFASSSSSRRYTAPTGKVTSGADVVGKSGANVTSPLARCTIALESQTPFPPPDSRWTCALAPVLAIGTTKTGLFPWLNCGPPSTARELVVRIGGFTNGRLCPSATAARRRSRSARERAARPPRSGASGRSIDRPAASGVNWASLLCSASLSAPAFINGPAAAPTPTRNAAQTTASRPTGCRSSASGALAQSVRGIRGIMLPRDGRLAEAGCRGDRQ